MENGTWASTAAKQMRAKVEELKDMTILDTQVSVKSALKEAQEEQMDALCAAIVESMKE